MKVTAVDPLADDYNDMLDQAGIIPIVRTRRGEAETLTSLLPADSFDLSHAVNCLDHCYDPVKAIREMIAVTKPGCYILLEHAPNEAETQRYQGLHHWNFCVEQDRFIIWRPGTRYDVADLVSDLGSVKATGLPAWVRIEIRKHPTDMLNT